MSEHSVERERENFLASVDRLADRIEHAEVCPRGHRHLPPVLDRTCWTDSAELLNSGEWTPAGGGLEVRLEEPRC